MSEFLNDFLDYEVKLPLVREVLKWCIPTTPIRVGSKLIGVLLSTDRNRKVIWIWEKDLFEELSGLPRKSCLVEVRQQLGLPLDRHKDKKFLEGLGKGDFNKDGGGYSKVEGY